MGPILINDVPTRRERKRRQAASRVRLALATLVAVIAAAMWVVPGL